jgi:hypothetical protein
MWDIGRVNEDASAPSFEDGNNGDPERRKAGRPKGSTKLQPTEEMLKQIQGLARIQCTRREAAAVIGVHYDTFNDFLQAHEEALIAWEDGGDTGKASLRRAQYKNAMDGSATMQIWLGKQWLDQTDKSYQEIAGKDGTTLVPSVNVTINKT